MMTHRHPTNVVLRLRLRQLHRGSTGPLQAKGKKVGGRDSGLEHWEVLRLGIWQAIEGILSSREIKRHGILVE